MILKMVHSRPLFLHFCLFNPVDSKQCLIYILPMTGFEPRTSGVGTDRFANWATTTAHKFYFAIGFFFIQTSGQFLA